MTKGRALSSAWSRLLDLEPAGLPTWRVMVLAASVGPYMVIVGTDTTGYTFIKIQFDDGSHVLVTPDGDTGAKNVEA